MACVLSVCAPLAPWDAQLLTAESVAAWKARATRCVEHVLPSVARGPVALQYSLAMHARYVVEHVDAFEGSGVRPVFVPDECEYGRPASAATYSDGELRDAFACRALMRVRLLSQTQQAATDLLSVAGSHAVRAEHRVWFMAWDVSSHPDDLMTAWRALDESPGACVVVPLPDTNGPGERGVVVDGGGRRGAPDSYVVVDAASVAGRDASAPAGTVRAAASTDMDWALASASTFASVPFTVSQVAKHRVTVDSDGTYVTGTARVGAFAGEHVGWFHGAKLRGVPLYAVADAKSVREQ